MNHYYSIKVFWIWLYTYFYQWVLNVHMRSCWLPGMWWVFSLAAFKILYLSLPFKNSIIMCLREVLFMFNLFGILSSLWIRMLISLYSFEISSVIISLNMISVSFSSSETLSFETPKMFMLIHFMVYHKSCGLCSPLCHSYLLLFSNVIIWNYLSSGLLILCSIEPAVEALYWFLFCVSSFVFFSSRISVVLICDLYLFVKLTLFMYF